MNAPVDLTGQTAMAVPVIIVLLGLVLGSFLNVVIHRTPREGLSVVRPTRSFCPACGRVLRWHDNLPVVSWLQLRGRCRDCRQPISVRYPLVEAASALLALHLYCRYGLSWAFFFHLYVALCLAAIALIDLELTVIPTVLVYPAILLSLVSAVLAPDVSLIGPGLRVVPEPGWGACLTSLAGALAGMILGWGVLKLVSATYKLLRGHDGLGDGDPPLLGLIGAFLGWQAVPAVLLWSGIIGLANAAIRKPPGGWAGHAMPFGPCVILAAFIYMAIYGR